MTKDPINDDWLISADLSAQDSKTRLNAANGLQFDRQTISRTPHPHKGAI